MTTLQYAFESGNPAHPITAAFSESAAERVRSGVPHRPQPVRRSLGKLQRSRILPQTTAVSTQNCSPPEKNQTAHPNPPEQAVLIQPNQAPSRYIFPVVNSANRTCASVTLGDSFICSMICRYVVAASSGFPASRSARPRPSRYSALRYSAGAVLAA